LTFAKSLSTMKLRILALSFFIIQCHCQNSGEDRLDRNSAPDECQRVKGVIGEIEYTLTEKNPNLRVDLVIVGTDDKTVHQATYWPSTGYGIVSNYKRLSSGHLEDDTTISHDNDFNKSNLLELFDLHIRGKYTLELSDEEGVFATLCLSKTNPQKELPPKYTDCRVKQDEIRVSRFRNARNSGSSRDRCSVPQPSGVTKRTSPKTFVRFQCP